MRRRSQSPEDRKSDKEEQKDKQLEEQVHAREAPGAKELYQNIINIPEEKKPRLDREPSLILERSRGGSVSRLLATPRRVWASLEAD